MDESVADSKRVPTSRPVFSGCLTILAFVIVLPAIAVYIAARPAMPRHLLHQVRPGMTKAEVQELLGEPQDREGEHQWEYWRWGNAGWVEVFFNQEGTVNYANDESAFP